MAIRAVVLERENVNLKQGNITLIYRKVRMITVGRCRIHIIYFISHFSVAIFSHYHHILYV